MTTSAASQPAAASPSLTSGQAASLVIGQSSFTTGTSGSGLSSLNGPAGVAFDSKGNLWVSDSSNDTVREYPAPLSTGEAASVLVGKQGTSPTQSSLATPGAIVFDSKGNLWVADSSNNRVLEFSQPISTGEAASVVLGQSDYVSNSCAASAKVGAATLCSPSGLAFDTSGNLWVADGGFNRVVEFVSPLSSGMPATVVIGQSGFTTTGSGTSATTLNTPQGLAMDSKGNLWVTDNANARILEFSTPLSNGEAATVVIGEPDFTTTCFPFCTTVTAKSLSYPSAVTFDSSGNLWVADSNDYRALMYPTPFSNGEAATAVIGQASLTANAQATTATGLAGAASVVFDSSGNLWVSDSGNNRVLEFMPGGPTASTTTTSTSTSSVAKTTSTTSSVTTTTSTTSTKTDNRARANLDVFCDPMQVDASAQTLCTAGLNEPYYGGSGYPNGGGPRPTGTLTWSSSENGTFDNGDGNTVCQPNENAHGVFWGCDMPYNPPYSVSNSTDIVTACYSGDSLYLPTCTSYGLNVQPCGFVLVTGEVNGCVIPEFPIQPAITLGFAVLLVGVYLFLTRGRRLTEESRWR